MDFNTLILFLFACLTINLIPGPDVIYIVSNTIKGKMVVGFKAALGLGLGYVIHTLAASLGLSAIIVSSSLAFSIVKWLGAAYLVYLAIQSLYSMWCGQATLSAIKSQQSTSNVFVHGIVVSVLNPKVALFFLSFLPQFVDPASGSLSGQLLMLGLIFSLLATLCNLFYASVGNWLFARPSAQRYSRMLEGVSGVLLLALASKVALSER